MTKKKLIVIAVAVVVVALALLIGVTLGRRSGGGDAAPGEQGGGAYQDSDVTDTPELTDAQAAAAEASSSKAEQSKAELPIDERILGKWEDKDMGTHQYNYYYEFFPDGSLLTTTYRLHDKDYPEEWYTHTREYHFDTWRGQEVLESDFFKGYAHHRVEFYELDGRQAMDFVTIKDDNSEYVSWTLLKVEE